MDHTEEEKAIMAEYEQSIDLDVKSFIEDTMAGTGKLNYVTVAFLSSRAAVRIKELTGKSVMGNRVVLDVSAVNHIEKRHGMNGNQDQSMKDVDDISRIGYVLSNFDDITWNGETSYNHIDEAGNPSPMVQFSKRIDGTIYVVQTVSEVRSRRNYIVTAYIKKKQPSNP